MCFQFSVTRDVTGAMFASNGNNNYLFRWYQRTWHNSNSQQYTPIWGHHIYTAL